MLLRFASRVQWDLGAKRLCADWKSLLTTRDLKADVLSGLTVACVAIPLSLAIALASGVPPVVGLISAIVGGLVCAIFGGTPLAVSGPTAAMAVLIASAGQKYGFGGVLAVGFGCGLLQVFSGVLGFGKWARLVPAPVIAGFSAGIGAVILIGQLPRALGLPPPPANQTLDVLTHLTDYLHTFDPTSLSITAATMAIIFLLPKVFTRIPATLVAVVVTSLAVDQLGLSTALIGVIPDTLPAPALPEFPSEGLLSLMLTSLAVFAFGTIETLLSSIAIDKVARGGVKHDPNQELIGQGLGNVAVSMFGGIPIAGVIARSALNAQSGGRTRRAALIHAVVVLLAVLVGSTIIAKIPLAALAGVLLAAAIKMLNVKEFRAFMAVSRAEAFVYALTFATIVVVDLLIGIQVGILAAVLIVAIRATRTTVAVYDGDVARVHLEGPFTFLASTALQEVRTAVTRSGRAVLDLRGVTRVDASAAEELIAIVGDTCRAGGQVYLQGARPAVRELLERADVQGVLSDRMLVSECELQGAFSEKRVGLPRLAYGVERFRADRELRLKPLLEKLAFDQKPHTLFLTCSDSRINPNLLTGTDLGELFVVRNVGNAFPPFEEGVATSEGGALEFGILALGIRDIVICGHTGCGAMKAVSGLIDLTRTQTLARYLASPPFIGLHGAFKNPDDCSRANVLTQRRNLMTYPFIRDLVRTGELKVHLWIYDLSRADVDSWNESTGQFETAFAPGAGAPRERSRPPEVREVRA